MPCLQSIWVLVFAELAFEGQCPRRFLRGRYQGNYGAQEALEGWLMDSTNVLESVVVDGEFLIEDGAVVDGFIPGLDRQAP